jgi:hypothetical protein
VASSGITSDNTRETRVRDKTHVPRSQGGLSTVSEVHVQEVILPLVHNKVASLSLELLDATSVVDRNIHPTKGREPLVIFSHTGNENAAVLTNDPGLENLSHSQAIPAPAKVGKTLTHGFLR